MEGSAYTFTVVVASATPGDNRSASAQTVLQAVAANAPVVTLSSVPALVCETRRG